MSGPHQLPEAEGVASSFAGASSGTGTNPVQIILTPPTPITPTDSLARRGEDTHKEVHHLPDVSQEKEVVDNKDYSDEKQAYSGHQGDEEKEVYVPLGEKEVYTPGMDEEAHRPHPGHDEKQVCDTGDGVYSPEKEVCIVANEHDKPMKEVYQPDQSMAVQLYNSHQSQRNDSVSTQSTETQDPKKSSIYERHMNKLNKAVDKKKQAWSTFTNESTASMTNKYNQFGKDVKDRRMAFEQGTTTKITQLEKGFSERVDRAGKNVNAKVSSWKQGVNNVKSQSVNSVKSLSYRGKKSEKGDEGDNMNDGHEQEEKPVSKASYY
ncbi:hypothetical protein F66182_1165 [Fusarium sp. NRRL 66182]|nr:hypothetical protein F66182_1165 [Fusarium sp. NRRL 66182]